MTRVSVLFLLLLVAMPSASAQQQGDLKITFQYKGPVPPPRVLVGAKPPCANVRIVDQSLIVNDKNKGIANVVAYVHTGRGGVAVPPQPSAGEQAELTLQNCQLSPRVQIARVDNTLKIKNLDPIGYNLNLGFFANDQVNANVGTNEFRIIDLRKPEPAPVGVSCNIHSWIIARLLVLDHPFGAVSDKDGVLIIKGLPVGRKLVFRVWHERLSFKNQVVVNGKKDDWKLSRFEWDVKPGLNDLGVVEIR